MRGHRCVYITRVGNVFPSLLINHNLNLHHIVIGLITFIITTQFLDRYYFYWWCISCVFSLWSWFTGWIGLSPFRWHLIHRKRLLLGLIVFKRILPSIFDDNFRSCQVFVFSFWSGGRTGLWHISTLSRHNSTCTWTTKYENLPFKDFLLLTNRFKFGTNFNIMPIHLLTTATW